MEVINVNKTILACVIAIGCIGLVDRAIERHQRFVRFSNEDLTTMLKALEKIGREEAVDCDSNEIDA